MSDFDKAMQFIENMAEYPDEIALYTNDLTGNDNSVLVALSNFTSEILKQDFTLDAIYVYGNEKLPAAKPGIFKSVGNWFGTLLSSFTTNKYVKIHPVTLQLRQDANHILPGIRHRKPEGLKNIRPVDQRVKIQCFRNRINALILPIRWIHR